MKGMALMRIQGKRSDKSKPFKSSSFFPKYHLSFPSQNLNKLNRTMNPAKVFLCFIMITINVGCSHPTHFTDDTVSINCGSTATSSAYSGTKWLGDVQPRASSLPLPLPLLQLKGSSTTSTASSKSTSVDPVPYKTARVSRSWFSYAFRVNSGQKIIRLHFNPSVLKGLKDLFTVEAASFTLLSNFSASLTANALRLNSLTKEFCLNVQQNQLLHITFSSQSKDAFAFINGIQIISLPPTLSYIQGGDIGLQVVGQSSLVNLDNSIALEIIRQLSTKQDLISSAIFGMTEVGNVSWKVAVDVGFRYLVRLHFSKLGLKMAQSGALKFKVFINEMIADTNADTVVKGRDGTSIPWYGDYIVMMNGHKREGKRDLLICVQSNEEFMDGPLKGFEILKLSNHDNSLASPFPMPPYQDSTSQTIRIFLKVLGSRNTIGTVAVTILCIVSIIVHKLREISEASSSEVVNRPSARAERLCRRFSLSEMQLATRNFSDGLIIGRGGFGKVYKGLIDKERNTVAVKRLKPNSSQGAHEFLMEIETLSELRHINLVPLIGYCSEGREMILVYEYMACGTLSDHLYNLARRGIDASSLTWKQRLSICIGAARGLDYLHTGHRVIHRDVKASNILLDDNFVAKVSDFGLARSEDRSKLQSHVSTKVKGTFGYLDPYYFSTRKLTRKSDTYAFGVVLLEVLCGRAAVDSEVSEDERILCMWARDKITKGEVVKIVASSLRDEISHGSLKTFLEITGRCLHEEPKNRPTMSQVVLQLELALERQDSNRDLGLNEITSVSDEIRPSTSNDRTHLFGTAMPNQQTNHRLFNSDLISLKKRTGKSTRNKPSRLWPWNALWKRVQPPKYEVLLSGVKLFKLDWDQIAAATNHFSFSNRTERSRYGPHAVYKAVLPSGEIVAVKRHSSSSWHLEELRNEISVLPNLQHPNIIKLHGYCIDGEVLLLVYDFMGITSCLDHYIGQQRQLGWGVRYQIIMGIARVLIYLHHDSVVRVIHRNLNLENILLDLEMNPKVTGFESAREFLELNQSLETTRIVGTYRYMPPEYLAYGAYSVKTDVYSFGIILLEIVSGFKSSSTDGGHQNFGVDVWRLWTEGSAIEFIDKSLDASVEDEAIRCIQVALLCIQENPDQRPLMSSVIKMLEGNEEMMQPHPPAWSNERSINGIVEGLDSNATFEFDDTLET